MKITEQLNLALDDMLRAQTANPNAGIYDLLDHAIRDVMAVMKPTGTYSSHLAEALFNMRAAMTATETKGKRPTDLPDVPALNEFDAGRTHYADPTGQLAVKTNAARTQHRDITNAIAILAGAADRTACDDPKHKDASTCALKAGYVHSLVLRWLPRQATPQERAETERANDPDAKGCVSCSRTKDSRGVPRWEPVYYGDLCSFCYRGPVGKTKTGTAPSVALVEAHHADNAAGRKLIARAVAELVRDKVSA